ncbi:MAG: helix-hairpin-helix domain-containing protein, partial [Alistipes sp.]|nr:helix-hairpin-helix domain-containing protein [Alistipes sp.]
HNEPITEPIHEPQPQRVEINTADSLTLVALDGIGAKSASEIIKYRTLLGGYYRVEQLRELKSVTESNFEKILPKIWCDSFVISKIDINFARSLELERHPYISARALRRIVKQRQLKGGWRRIEEMIDDDILSEEEAERLAPYLRFRLSATE